MLALCCVDSATTHGKAHPLSPTVSVTTDLDLLQRWGEGDADAGEALIERHFAPLYRFFRNKVDRGIDDLVQQTFLGCLEARDRFRADSSFRTFLLSIARYQLYSHYRKASKHAPPDFSMTSMADLATSPSGLLARKDESQLLLAALRRLPIDLQVAIELYFWEDLRGHEIAESLGLPVPTAYGRVRRAREQLREELAKLGSGILPVDETVDDLEAWARRVRDELRRT